LIALVTFLGPEGGGGAYEVGDSAVSEVDEVACPEIAAVYIVDLDTGEVGIGGWGWAEDDGGEGMAAEFVCGGGLRFESVDGEEEEAVDAARDHAADEVFFAIGLVEGMSEDEVEAGLVDSFFDGEEEAGEDGVGDSGDDEADEAGGAGAQALSEHIGHVAHFIGKGADSGFGISGDIRFISQDLGDGHDGNAGALGDIFEPDGWHG